MSVTALILGKRTIFSCCGRTAVFVEKTAVRQGVKAECLWCPSIQAVHFYVHLFKM